MLTFTKYTRLILSNNKRQSKKSKVFRELFYKVQFLLQINMENATSMVQRNEEQQEGDNNEALQLVKNEERQEMAASESNVSGNSEGAGAAAAAAGSESNGEPHSVITSRRALRTITTAGHITDASDINDEGVKDEPPEQAQQLEHEHMQYAPKMEDSDGRGTATHYDEERLRMAEVETARYLAFKQEPYRSLQSPTPAPQDKRLPPPQQQYGRGPPPRTAYGRGLALRYGPSHHVIVAQEGETEEHSHEVFLQKEKAEQLQQAYVASESANAQDGRQYGAVLSDQVAVSSALEMIQTTSLSNQQAVGVAYQQVVQS